MIKVGSYVKIKAVETTPEYAGGTMRSLFGKDYVYMVHCTGTHRTYRTAYLVQIPRTEDEVCRFVNVYDYYWYQRDLQELSEEQVVAEVPESIRLGFQPSQYAIIRTDRLTDSEEWSLADSLAYPVRSYNAQVARIKCPYRFEWSLSECKVAVSSYRATVLFSDEETRMPASVLEQCPEDYVAPNPPIPRRCERCGARYLIDEGEHIWPEDECLCPECRKRLFVASYHHYMPHLTFFKCADETTSLFYGAEIEVGEGGEYDSNAALAMNIFNPADTLKDGFRITASHDGSLRNGIEFVTAPMTLKYHKSMEPLYRNMFRFLVRSGYRAHDTGYCGLHFHFSREFYAEDGNETENIDKLLYLVSKHWDDLVVFSRRHEASLDRYAKKPFNDRDDYIDSYNKSENHDGHYYAVNISNPNTIELRMFRGTLNFDTYMITLEFVDSIVRAAKEKSLWQLSRMAFEDFLPNDQAKEYFSYRKTSLKFEQEKGD